MIIKDFELVNNYKYFIYIDRDDNGNPYYCGLGDVKRINKKERNKFHKNVAEKYGLNRSIEYATNDYDLLKDIEILFIEHYETFKYKESINIHRCNLTLGGDGTNGRNVSIETRIKLANGRLGKVQTEEAKKKISLANTGKIRTEEFKRNVSENNPMKRKEIRDKLAKSVSGENNPMKRKEVREKFEGDNSPSAKFGPEIRDKIFLLRKQGLGYTKISIETRVSRSQVRNIIKKYLENN
jgi:hypothetical protein